MQLGQAEALGVLDDHHRGIGGIDADLDHRGRHQHIHLSGPEVGRHGFLFRRLHPAMQQANPFIAQRRPQVAPAVLRGRQFRLFAFLHQGADPIHPVSLGNGPPDPVHDFAQPFHRHQPGLRRDAPGRLFVQSADIQIAIDGERQGARNGRGGHDQRVRAITLRRQAHPVRHPEAVLLVDHHQAQIGKIHAVLEQRMRAAHHVHRARSHAFHDLAARLALVATGQRHHRYPGRLQKRC